MTTIIQKEDSGRLLRDTLGRFPTGVAIVTAMTDKHRPVGMTINSLTSISLDPALLAWSIDQRAASYETFTRAGGFAVSVLAQSQADLARRFATRGIDKFDGLDIESGDAPIIPDACAWFRCQTWQSFQLGDHRQLVGKIVDYGHSDLPPLLFLSGQFQHPGYPVSNSDRVAA